MTEISQEFEI